MTRDLQREIGERLARAMAKWTRPSSEDVAADSELAYLQLEKERG
jgi:hypothetical protein